MHKLTILLLCSAILLTGCADGAETKIVFEPEYASSQTQIAAPSEAPIETPSYTADITLVNETADATSNIENGGTVVTDGEHIYIATDKLYVNDMYFNEGAVLLDMADICFLNLYEDYIYFVCAADYGIYRIRKDGQGLERLPVTGAFNLVAAGSNLFYQYSVGENADNKLYKCDLLGLNKECLNITASSLCAGDTGIYFSNEDDNGYLYKYVFDGDVMVKVRSDDVKQINIVGGSIYYIASNEGNNIVSINSTGSGRKVIVNEPCRYLNHMGSSLVFSAEESGGIEKISFDSSGREIVLDIPDAHAFNIAGDYIFFESFPLPSSDAVAYRVRLDGTGLYPDFPEQSLAFIKDFDTDTMTLELDYVELLTGDAAVEAYSYDNGLSKKKAGTIIENDMQGTYLRNQSPKLREYRLTTVTGITLLTKVDGSLDMNGYSASSEDFAALYMADSELCKSMMYYVTAQNGEIISIQQQYFEGILP